MDILPWSYKVFTENKDEASNAVVVYSFYLLLIYFLFFKLEELCAISFGND